jgi:hypothetical protein
MEEFRAAAVDAIDTLGHAPIVAEDFSADSASPRVACLQGLREADIVVLLLGGRYGEPLPPNGLSATHQEYREARGSKPVLAFVQLGAAREDSQSSFIAEVEDWEHGHFRGSFTTVEDLRKAVTKALHQRELAIATAPVDGVALLENAKALLSENQSGRYSSSAPRLKVAVAGGPIQQILRPSQIEQRALAESIMQRALFGSLAMFDTSIGSTTESLEDKLRVKQENGNFVQLDEKGDVAFGVGLHLDDRFHTVIVVEEVAELLAKLLRFSASLLDEIDSSQKISRVAVAAILEGGDYLTWKRRSEYDPNATSIRIGHSFSGQRSGPVHQSPPDFARAALSFEADRIAEDLVTLLKRTGGS